MQFVNECYQAQDGTILRLVALVALVASVQYMQFATERYQAQDGTILCLVALSHKLHKLYQCRCMAKNS
jgi:K+ transporter